MNAMPDRWRRISIRIVRHASWVLPGPRSPWAEAMRRELDYIEDNRAALRWAVGCVTASYAARLAALLRPRWRALTRPVLAGSMLLFMALALGHAGDRTAPSPAVFEDPPCDRPGMTPDTRPGLGVPRDRARPASGAVDRQSGAAAGCVVCRSQSTDPSCLTSADTMNPAGPGPSWFTTKPQDVRSSR